MGKISPRNRRRDAARAKAIAHTHDTDETEERLKNATSRAAVIGSSLVHLGLTWAVVAGLVFVASHSPANPHHQQHQVDGYTIPQETLSPWTEYPNPLNITDQDRASFHPVVVFPTIWADVPQQEDSKKKPKREKVANYQIIDLKEASATNQLASEEERQERRKLGKRPRNSPPPRKDYAVGRYDENRPNLYASDMFDDKSHDIDGYAGARTVHIGIDLDGPIGTKVFAFADGVVHSAGYNAELGDYGNVVVVEHDLGPSGEQESRKMWALYGHLDDKSIKGKTKGTKIKKGQVIGRFGDIHENGGWYIPHVHFQLSIFPPETHDMPGVVSMADRPRALVHYPDPRQVLGPLY